MTGTTPTKSTMPWMQKPFVAPVILGLGVALLIIAALLWFNQPVVQTVSIEGEIRQAGFSLGLDDPDVVNIDRQGARQFWSGSETALKNGFAAGIAKIWPDLERAVPDPTLAAVKIIPSGGMFPFYRSSTYSGEIDAFVRNGGSLICMGQPLGAMYKALPGAPEGIGWAEMGTKPRDAQGYIEKITNLPVMANMGNSSFKAYFSGVFTKWPAQTQLLMHDSFSKQPTLIAYRHGKGMVIVTTLMGDVASMFTKLSREESTLYQTLLLWAQSGAFEMTSYQPEVSLDFTYRLKPGAGQAYGGFVELYSPYSHMDESFPCSLPVDGQETVTEPFRTPNEPGIWRVVSYRRDAEGNPAGPASSTWFTISNVYQDNTKPVGIHFAVAVPGYYLPAGATVPVKVYIWNNTPDATEVTYGGTAAKRSVKLAAGEHKMVQDDVTLPESGFQTLTYDFFSAVSGLKLETIRKRVDVGHPDRVFIIMGESIRATSGQTVTLNPQFLALNPGVFTADAVFRLVHNGEVYWQEERPIKLNGAYSVKETIKVPVGTGSPRRMVFETVLTYRGRELASSWMEIDVTK